jgi:rhodanese-related sulfurtransferase
MIKKNTSKVYVVCVRGNDSQLAVQVLEGLGIDAKDIVEGYNGFKDFPVYQ